MADTLAWLQAALEDTPQLLMLMAANIAVNGAFVFGLNKVFGAWSLRQSWWPAAIPHQKRLMSNFCYPEEDQTPDAVLETWSFVLVMSIHHTFCGCLTLPVLIQGWEAAGATGQLCFYIGLLVEMGFDLYDVLRATILRCCPSICPCMTKVPMVFYILGICHHSLSVILVLPMLRNYPETWEFHWLACTLLFAAGVSAATGAYKFTLDTNEPSGFSKYKCVVVLQLVVIWITRAILWFWATISLLMHFWSEGDLTFFWVGAIVVAVFSLFNLATVADATSAAVKWLPKAVPSTEEEKMFLEKSKTDTSLAILTRVSSRNLDKQDKQSELVGVEL